MSQTPAPSSTIEWNTLGLTVNDTVNGHVESTFSAESGGWSDTTFVKEPYVRVHGLSPALNYGMQAYEGLKAIRLPSGAIAIFRPSFHAARLSHSATVVSMPEVPEDVFIKCVSEAVRRNAEFVGPNDTDAVLYIRPVLFGSGPQLALEPPSEFTLAVYVQPATNYHGLQPLDCVIMEEFDRAAPRGSGHAKVGGNYAPVMRWSRAAQAEGYSMTLHLDSATQREIDEFSTSGFVGVKKGKDDEQVTVVVPNSKSVIDSVTSDSCLQIAGSLGWKVERRRVAYEELAEFDEVLAVGTAALILPIQSITRKSTGDKFIYCPSGKTGSCAVQLGSKLKQVQRGQTADEFGWLHEIDFSATNQDRWE